MEHNAHVKDYENIMRNYPLTVMTKTYNPSFPGPVMPGKALDYTKVAISEHIQDIVIKSPQLKTLLDTVSDGNE